MNEMTRLPLGSQPSRSDFSTSGETAGAPISPTKQEPQAPTEQRSQVGTLPCLNNPTMVNEVSTNPQLPVTEQIMYVSQNAISQQPQAPNISSLENEVSRTQLPGTEQIMYVAQNIIPQQGQATLTN